MAWGAEAIVSYEGPVIRPDENEHALKMAYAAVVAANPSQWKIAGYKVFPGPGNEGRALQAQRWYHDPIVQQELSRLEGPKPASQTIKPTPDQWIEEAWRRSKDTRLEDKVQREYFEMVGIAIGAITKGGTNVNVNTNVQNNRFEVPMQPRNDDEEARFAIEAEKQQLKLVSDARTNRTA